MRDESDDQELHLDGKRELGYDGTASPVRLEDVNTGAPAVILGALQPDGHIIRAEGMGVLVVENLPVAENG